MRTVSLLSFFTVTAVTTVAAFQPLTLASLQKNNWARSSSESSNNENSVTTTTKEEDIANMITARFPTSPEDQVRQAFTAIQAASQSSESSSDYSPGTKRHSIRLLLPIIGATELDDWPGGARQMMEAAAPLMTDLLTLLGKDSSNSNSNNSNTDNDNTNNAVVVQESVIDPVDGVRALFSQATNPIDDACAVLLPSADNTEILQTLNQQVGDKRNLILVNAQWKRKSDFGSSSSATTGGFLPWGKKNSREETIEFVEGFEPTFHCSNVMVEGDIVRILRTFPGPWRVYLRTVLDSTLEDVNVDSNIDWVEIGSKELLQTKTAEWEKEMKELGGVDKDGGKMFDYGMPSYKEIQTMIVSREGYVPKSLSERAAAALTFIKDTL